MFRSISDNGLIFTTLTNSKEFENLKLCPFLFLKHLDKEDMAFQHKDTGISSD